MVFFWLIQDAPEEDVETRELENWVHPGDVSVEVSNVAGSNNEDQTKN